MRPLTSVAKAIIPRRYVPFVSEVYGRVRAPLYAGDRVGCPCCGGRFRKFLPYGPRRRPNSACPRCGSQRRHRLLWLYLHHRTPLLSGRGGGPELPGETGRAGEPGRAAGADRTGRAPRAGGAGCAGRVRLLHVAPERFLQRLLAVQPHIEYVSADLDSPLATVRMDITAIPEPDESYDVILGSHVLEHVPDDRKAMRELCRVLRRGGWAILQVPLDPARERTFEDPTITAPGDRERLFGRHDHVRVYGRDYGARLEEAGFRVTVDGYVRELGAEAVARYGLEETEDIYLCTRP